MMTLISQLDGGRRDFLKRSGLLSGIAASGILGMSGIGAACSEYASSDEYEDEPYALDLDVAAEWDDPTCEDMTNSGTMVSGSASGIYWESHQWSDGDWTHRYQQNGHAQGYEQNSRCNWIKSDEIAQQWLGARTDVYRSEATFTGNQRRRGSYPPTESGLDMDNTIYTAATVALGAFKRTPYANAAGLAMAMYDDLTTSSSSEWDATSHWTYDDAHPCVSHSSRFYQSASQEESHIEMQSWFTNNIGSVRLTTRYNISNPETDPSTTTEDTSTSSTQAPKDPGKGNKPEKGDMIELPNGKCAKVASVATKEKKSERGRERKPSEKEFKERHPVVYEQRGVPERIVELPAHGETTAVTATHLDE